MTDKTESKTFHAIVDGSTIPSGGFVTGGRVLSRGDEFEVTPEFIEMTTDRFGDSWAADLSPEAQVTRWGVQRYAAGALSSNPKLADQIAAEATAAAAARNQERLHEAHRYGRAHAQRVADDIAALKGVEA